MTLTPAQQAHIDKPFALNEHGFKGDNPYILKSALRQRLNQVDPNWTTGQPVVLHIDDDVVTMALPLTIAGITRYGVGTGIIQRTKKNKETGEVTELGEYDLLVEKAKARKVAASDAVPRAFLEFRGGSYLKDKPASVKKAGFATWLASLTAAPSTTHWAANGGLERINKILIKLGLQWNAVKDLVEPGRTLAGLSETTLDETMFTIRLAEIAFKPATPQAPPPAPPPAPIQSPTAETSAPTSATAPAIVTAGAPAEAPIDLKKYFSDPAPEPTATAPANPFTKVYPAGAYGNRRTVPSYKNPTGRKERIGYIKCMPVDLDTKDIILTADGPQTIIAAYPPEQGERRFLLKDAAGEEHDYKLTVSLGLAEIVGGPKLAQVQDNPDLAPMSGPHRLWIGDKKVSAAS